MIRRQLSQTGPPSQTDSASPINARQSFPRYLVSQADTIAHTALGIEVRSDAQMCQSQNTNVTKVKKDQHTSANTLSTPRTPTHED